MMRKPRLAILMLVSALTLFLAGCDQLTSLLSTTTLEPVTTASETSTTVPVTTIPATTITEPETTEPETTTVQTTATQSAQEILDEAVASLFVPAEVTGW